MVRAMADARQGKRSVKIDQDPMDIGQTRPGFVEKRKGRAHGTDGVGTGRADTDLEEFEETRIHSMPSLGLRLTLMDDACVLGFRHADANIGTAGDKTHGNLTVFEEIAESFDDLWTAELRELLGGSQANSRIFVGRRCDQLVTHKVSVVLRKLLNRHNAGRKAALPLHVVKCAQADANGWQQDGGCLESAEFCEREGIVQRAVGVVHARVEESSTGFALAAGNGDQNIFSATVIHLPERRGRCQSDLRLCVIEERAQSGGEVRVLRLSRSHDGGDSDVNFLVIEVSAQNGEGLRRVSHKTQRGDGLQLGVDVLGLERRIDLRPCFVDRGSRGGVHSGVCLLICWRVLCIGQVGKEQKQGACGGKGDSSQSNGCVHSAETPCSIGPESKARIKYLRWIELMDAIVPCCRCYTLRPCDTIFSLSGFRRCFSKHAVQRCMELMPTSSMWKWTSRV